jgi:hypothetical protein
MNVRDESVGERSGAGHVVPEAAAEQPPKGFLCVAAEGSG